MTTEKEELFADFPATSLYVKKLKERIDYLEKLLRPINLIPDHVLETMTPLEKLVASVRRKAGWCAYCGEYSPVQGFLSCENCIEREPEGGGPISEMMNLSSSSYCLACDREHPHQSKICVQCAAGGWYLDDSQRVCLEGGEK